MNKAKQHIMTDAEARAYIQGRPAEPTEEELEIKHVEYLVRNELRMMAAEPMKYLQYPENCVTRIQHYIDHHKTCPNVNKLEDVLREVKKLIAKNSTEEENAQ